MTDMLMKATSPLEMQDSRLLVGLEGAVCFMSVGSHESI